MAVSRVLVHDHALGILLPFRGAHCTLEENCLALIRTAGLSSKGLARPVHSTLLTEGFLDDAIIYSRCARPRGALLGGRCTTVI